MYIFFNVPEETTYSAEFRPTPLQLSSSRDDPLMHRIAISATISLHLLVSFRPEDL